MKQKALALAGIITAALPTVGEADVLPESLLGLNLGEISTSSFINQPFKGVIPFLLSSDHNYQNINVNLAPDSVYSQVGVEKLPILNSLRFQVTMQANKPVILISSDTPINLPFINFILEIEQENNSVYQDYTVLLDPESNKDILVLSEDNSNSYVATNDLRQIKQTDIRSELNEGELELLRERSKLILQGVSANSKIEKKPLEQYKVKRGDSLSKIAQKHVLSSASLKTISDLIFKNNPKAFIRGNIDRLKKGATLTLPSKYDVNDFILAKKQANKIAKKGIAQSKDTLKLNTNSDIATYTVKKGDSLSKVSKKYQAKGVSFTKTMNSIYKSNPTAFVNENKNKLKVGAKLIIPNFSQPQHEQYANKLKQEIKTAISKKDSMKSVNSTSEEAPKSANLKELAKTEISQTPNKVLAKAALTDNQIAKEAANNENTAPTYLIKRIRELRKELQLAKEDLARLKNDLGNKNTLLEQKNIQLESLNTLLTKVDTSYDARAITTSISRATQPIQERDRPLSKAEVARAKRDVFLKQAKIEEQLARVEELKKKYIKPDISISILKNKNDEITQSNWLELSNANYVYFTLALLLALILIRYRREIYTLTYSKINLDDQNYYPVPHKDKYDLSERNISFHDPKMDQETEEIESVIDELIAEKIEIDPVLVEAKTALFENSKLETIENDEEIKKCETLVTELFGDLNKGKSQGDKDWKDIEKVCETFIENNVSNDLPKNSTNKNAVVDEVTDFNHMMSDLLASLDKVDKQVKKSNLKDEDFPDIYTHSLLESRERYKKDEQTLS